MEQVLLAVTYIVFVAVWPESDGNLHVASGGSAFHMKIAEHTKLHSICQCVSIYIYGKQSTKLIIFKMRICTNHNVRKINVNYGITT
jgi:hypothetical protein